MPETVLRQPARRAIFFVLLLVISTGLALFALIIPMLTSLSSPVLNIDIVAPRDILAPQPITYVSKVLTEQQRESAARSVSPVYTMPDTAIARRQLEHLRSSLAFITSVRGDAYANPKQKLSDLAALEYIQIDTEPSNNILALSDSHWQAVQQEAIVVLEQVMRTMIREDRLDEARRSVPALVSLSLPDDQAAIVSSLVEAFVAPNSFYSESLTESARQKASQAVKQITRSYMTGETVVQRGKVIDATDMEALQELGLVQPVLGWKDIGSALALVLLAGSFLLFYFWRNRRLLEDLRGLALIALLFLVFLFGARLLTPGYSTIPYIYPIAAYSLIVSVLFGAETALITSLPLAILAAYGLSNALDLTLYYILGCLFGVLTLGRAQRITSFFWAGIAIACSGSLVVIIYNLNQPTSGWFEMVTLIGMSFVNGIASASLCVLLQFFLAQFLGLTTALQLMEISRPDHPLLQLILRNSPGTYQHSLQVANLAEQAAERIGADPLLTRVGALYHDVGKAREPAYFIENQLPGSVNPHDELDPFSSSQMILQHVQNGLELAQKYHIPRRIQDFIAEHHGTTIMRYQYAKAVDAAGGDREQVPMEKFRYPGPRPNSRETAILMLADGCEARMRADHPKDENELRLMIKNVVDNRMATGQLDKTDLTLRDLNEIVDSFTTTLKGVYHPRIEYPKLEPALSSDSEEEKGISPKTVPIARSSSEIPAIQPPSESSAANS